MRVRRFVSKPPQKHDIQNDSSLIPNCMVILSHTERMIQYESSWSPGEYMNMYNMSSWSWLIEACVVRGDTCGHARAGAAYKFEPQVWTETSLGYLLRNCLSN